MLITVYWYCFLKTVPVRKITVKAKITVPSVNPEKDSAQVGNLLEHGSNIIFVNVR